MKANIDIDDLYFSFSSYENPDWDFARVCRSLLLVPSAEFCQSIFSAYVPEEGYHIAPNRDFPYEGLEVLVDGENWKFIDALPFGLMSNLEWTIVKPKTVKIYPWKVVYCYVAKKFNSEKVLLDIDVVYSLIDKDIPEGASLLIEFKIKPKNNFGMYRLVLSPLIDIRHMYADSDDPRYYHVGEEFIDGKRAVLIQKSEKTIIIGADTEENIEIKRYVKEYPNGWWYKLGNGGRIEKEGKTIFNEGIKRPVFAGKYQIFFESKDVIAFPIVISCASTRQKAKELFSHAIQTYKGNEEKEKKKLYEIIKKLDLNITDPTIQKALLARVISLAKFGMYVRDLETGEQVKIPQAGIWWFKTPWFRDVFEGILSSIYTLLKIPEWRENIRKILLLSMRYQDPESGRIPQRLPEFKGQKLPFDSADATLLCFLTAGKYVKLTDDIEVAEESIHGIKVAVERFREGDINEYEGRPVIDDAGLLLCVPWHSWTDTHVKTINYLDWTVWDLPNRISDEFGKELLNEFKDAELMKRDLFTPKYFLPEINAQWIAMLKNALFLSDFVIKNSMHEDKIKMAEYLGAMCQDLYEKAKENYKNVFWNPRKNFLYNLVRYDLKMRDEIEGSPAVVAAAILGKEVFSINELEKIWARAEEMLLVNRSLVDHDFRMKYGEERKTFGILVKNSAQRIYYDDHQYHEAVMWARDTPYLIKLLSLIDREDIIKDILINNLDHQITESIIYYNNELFSMPLGNNPHAYPLTKGNPVPVKNPGQWWSQWVDPFLKGGD